MIKLYSPWKYTDDFINVYDSQNRVVASLDSDAAPDFSADESTDHARLISSAPDLLEAIEQILHRLEGPNNMQTVLYSDSLHPTDDDKTIVDYLQEVIAKATGK